MFRKDSTSIQCDGYVRIAGFDRTLIMRQLTILLMLLAFSAWSVGAQKLDNHGLVVTGAVVKIEAQCVEGQPFVALTLSLQIRNDSPDPLILISGSTITNTKLNFITTKPGASAETVVAGNLVWYNPHQENPWGPPSANDYDPDANWVKNHESRVAPEPIPPGGYRETQRVFGLTSGFRLSSKATEEFKACRPVKETPVLDYPSFYLEFRTSLKKYANGDEVMRLFQERWKPIGVLPLDSSGDISYRSEPIIIPSLK